MKHLIPGSLLLLLSSLSLGAVEIADMQSSSNDPCCPKPLPCCPPRPDCIPPKCAQLVNGPKGEITPNAGPCVACGTDFYLTADFIYWSVREDNVQFAFSSGTDLVAPLQGRSYFPNFKMQPGFKVGAGILFDHDGWDVFAEYTWIRSRNNTGTATPSPGIVIDTASGLGEFPIAISSITGEWELHYFNVIDLEMGRNFYISRYLKLRPHFGFKGTWQKQFFNITLNETDEDVGPITATQNANQFFWGFGIRAGLDAAFHFSRSFSAFGEIAAAGLYGQFEDSIVDLATIDATGVAIASGASPFNFQNNFHTIKPVFEWMLGLRWETYTCDKQFHFSLEAGWEAQYWLGQNQFTAGEWGDLILQGLTTKFRFDF